MITQLSYKLMLRDILRFVLNLFFGTGEEIPLCSFEVHQRIYHIVAARECCQPENKWKCTEQESKRMSDDLMELNATELNFVYFKVDSDDTSKTLDEDFAL